MVGKNNHIRTIKSNLKEHYKAYKAGRRWIYASLASLAVGAGLLLGSTTAYADAATNTSQEPAETESNQTTAATAQKTAVVPLKASQSASESANADETAKAADQSQATVDGASKAAEAAAVNSQQATVQPTQQANNSTAQTSEKKVLVDPTEDQLNAAKASAEQVYAATHQAQEIDAVAGEPASTTTGLTISESAIGTDTHAQSPLIITINANAKAGDIYKVTIPADNQLYTFDSVDSLGAEAGTTTTTLGTDGSHIITDTFATDTASTQRIKLNLTSPFLAPARMADVGKTVTKNVTFTVNGKPQTGVSFTQTVKPTTKLSTITMLHPDPSTVEQLLPNQNYIFGVSVNESDGIPYDDSFGTTNRASKVDNYGGTKIIIPVPTGFNLDSDSTAKMNAFTDGTTITQPGGKGTDVIINAPAGAGGQVGNNGILNSPEYQIVGAFDVSQTTTAQALTASGDVTFSQIINGDSTNNTITDSADPWKVTILPNNGGTNVGQSDVSPIAKEILLGILLN